LSKEIPAKLEDVEKTILAYNSEVDLEVLRRAYAVAEKAHSEQKRASGDPYILHPTAVALNLAQMRMDTASVITGLLHDTVEDTGLTLEQIEKNFGKDVSELVDGVTKLNKISFKTSEEKQAENFRKMIVAMAKDIRVIIVKLADRLNNMQTLQYLPQQKQRLIAQETLDIYAPIANRLGMSRIKIELEDLCLRYLHAESYSKLAQKIARKKGEREKYIEDVCAILREQLKEYDIKAEVSGRAKHFYSIFKKMEQRQVDFDQINDVIAFRIVVENITECYKALGVIHATYKPVPGRFKDYIAMPKANSYQSLHTTVIGPHGERIEIQIRTEDMHAVAEQGIAAHWSYKEGKGDATTRKSVEWVNRLMEWQKDLSDPNEFLETVKIDLFEEDVFVFTPKGEVKQLSHGATPLDFAYAVHTDVGHHCVGAKVNGKIVPLKHRLHSGDTVEVITSSTQQPSKDWLKIARSSRAKAKIRTFIKQHERERAKELGTELLEKSFRHFNQNYNKSEKSGHILKAAQSMGLKSIEELLVAVGYGRILPEDIVREVVPKEELEKTARNAKAEDETFLKRIFKSASKRSESRNAITVANLDDVLIRFGRCCTPLPGDSIIGFITRGRGVTVHAANCTKALDNDPQRRVDVRWNNISVGKLNHSVKIRIFANDEPGLLALLSQAISSSGVNISMANIRTTKDKKAICLFDVEVKDTAMLAKVISTLESKHGVISVERTRS
jgi:GTP pyrophosphokinase